MKDLNFYKERAKKRSDLKITDDRVEFCCSRCKQWLPRNKDYFYTAKSCFDKMNLRCIKCANETYLETRDKKKIDAYQEEYRKKNRLLIRSKKRIYYQNNKEKVKKKVKEYRLKNTAKINKYHKNKYNNDSLRKIMVLHRARIGKFFSKNKTYRANKSIEMLGCTPEEFKKHLESKFKEGMTWSNHGKMGWHVDHIIPLSTFDLSNSEQAKIAFHYTNTQPLWWHENLSKGNKLDQNAIYGNSAGPDCTSIS